MEGEFFRWSDIARTVQCPLDEGDVFPHLDFQAELVVLAEQELLRRWEARIFVFLRIRTGAGKGMQAWRVTPADLDGPSFRIAHGRFSEVLIVASRFRKPQTSSDGPSLRMRGGAGFFHFLVSATDRSLRRID
jgi:hypothetical protein